MTCARKPYPSDVSDDEWSLVVPYLTLVRKDAPQRQHSLRELFNALRYVVRYGIAWRAMPNNLPPWFAVSQQTQRWLQAGCFEMLVHDLRAVLRIKDGRAPESTAAIIDSRALRSTPESGTRADYDGAKRKCGSKVHMAVDTLGHLLALHVTPADRDDRAEVGRLAEAIQEATDQSVELAYVDQGYTGERPAAAAGRHGITLEVVKSLEAKAGSSCCRVDGWSSGLSPGQPDADALVKDYERYAATLAGLHVVAVACLMIKHAAHLMHSA